MSTYNEEFREIIKNIRNTTKTIAPRTHKIKPYLDEIMKVTNWLSGDDILLSERFYVIINNIFERPKCPVCNKEINFCRLIKKYKSCCSLVCANKSVAKKQSFKNTLKTRTIEEKNIIGAKIRDAMLSRPEEYKQEIINKMLDTKSNWTEEYKQEVINKMLDTKSKWTEEEKLSFSKMLSDTRKNRPKEEKDKIQIKRLQTVAGWSEEYRQEVKQKEMETRANYTDDEKKEISNKISKGVIAAKALLTHDEKKEIIKKQLSTGYKNKDYILPSGNIIKVQGYEHWALDELLEIYNEEDVITCGQMPIIIPYIFNNKNKNYFPDIFIPKENKIIEIKSTWTYEKDKEQNSAKFEATKNAGYIFECWVYNKNKEKITLKC
jgi:hypothetical protein